VSEPLRVELALSDEALDDDDADDVVDGNVERERKS